MIPSLENVKWVFLAFRYTAVTIRKSMCGRMIYPFIHYAAGIVHTCEPHIAKESIDGSTNALRRNYKLNSTKPEADPGGNQGFK